MEKEEDDEAAPVEATATTTMAVDPLLLIEDLPEYQGPMAEDEFDPAIWELLLQNDEKDKS